MNTLLIMADEHNPFWSSVYGHPYVQTPNLDRLARDGTLFANAYCPSPLCVPSRSAFMSGRRVHEIQVYSNCTVDLNPDFPSYGGLLAERGIHTAYCGKTDVYAPAEQLGFSELILARDRRYPGDTAHRRRPLKIRRGASRRATGYGPKEDAFQPDETRWGLVKPWLTEKAPKLGKPWTLTLNIGKPHYHHYARREFWDLYPQGEDLPACGPDEASANHPYARDLRDHFETDLFTPEQIRGLRRGYLACVSYVDHRLGEILAVLEETGQLAETNVIYCSDHGDMLGKFGMWWKCSLYEDSARVPLLAAGPAFAAGKKVSTPVDLLDLQATLFSIYGAARPPEMKGAPLTDIPENDPERAVFSEYHGHGTRAGAYLVRRGDWKLIHNCEAPHQLFNLAEDPQELRNLYPDQPGKAGELEEELRRFCDPEAENDRAFAFQERQFARLESEGLA